MLMWHKEGEQRMVETSKQKTQIQAHHKIAESATRGCIPPWVEPNFSLHRICIHAHTHIHNSRVAKSQSLTHGIFTLQCHGHGVTVTVTVTGVFILATHVYSTGTFHRQMFSRMYFPSFRAEIDSIPWPETGSREPGTGSPKPKTRNWELEIGNRKLGTGNRELGTGNRELPGSKTFPCFYS